VLHEVVHHVVVGQVLEDPNHAERDLKLVEAVFVDVFKQIANLVELVVLRGDGQEQAQDIVCDTEEVGICTVKLTSETHQKSKGVSANTEPSNAVSFWVPVPTACQSRSLLSMTKRVAFHAMLAMLLIFSYIVCVELLT